MEQYSIIPPSPILAPYVKSYWILGIGAGTPVTERILPTGCVQLTFHRAVPLISGTRREIQPQAFVCGQSISYSEVTTTGALDMISVVFRPCAAKLFLNIPLTEFYGRHVAARQIGDPALAGLSDLICETGDDSRCIALIEHFLTGRLRGTTNYHLPRIAATVQTIGCYPATPVAKLAQAACLSTKQYNRLFAAHVGITPKEFARIVRMQKALHILQKGTTGNFAQLAGECGFYDQSHMTREFKAFSGYTPAQYLTVCEPYSDYFTEEV